MCWLYFCLCKKKKSWTLIESKPTESSPTFNSCFKNNRDSQVKLRAFRKIDHNLSIHHNNKAIPVENLQAARLANHNALIY